MPAQEPRILALLPAVGLCSCVASSEAPASAVPSEPVAVGIIEDEPAVKPPTVVQAMLRSGRESLAAGHFDAAAESFSAAVEQYPEHVGYTPMDRLDVALEAGKLELAAGMIHEIQANEPSPDDKRRLQSRELLLLELSRGGGPGHCVANVDPDARPLRRSKDAFEAWNELRSALPANHAIPIPADEARARETLCGYRCAIGEPTFVRLEGDNEATVGLVVAHGDGGFSVMPDVLHTVDTGCGDQTNFAFERHDGLVRVRAFGDRLADWNLLELPTLPQVAAAPSPSYAYASGSSGYAPSPSYAYGSSGYQQGSSGSQAYAYGGSYYGGYGCGDGDYSYDSSGACQVQVHVERDVILDLDRGEVVLDIVRTGVRGSALGRVSMTSAPAGPLVHMQACGVRESLQLSYT
jgi:hypothetical protein